MSQTNPEVVPPVQKRERFAEKKFQTFQAAKEFQEQAKKASDNIEKGLVKAKVFARYDGTFDVVLYKDIEKAKEQDAKAEKILKDGVEKAKKVHGLTAKARRSKEKRSK